MDMIESEAKEDMEGRDFPPTEHLKKCLLDQSQPMGKRTRAAFFLRTLGTPPAVEAVCEALLVPSDSALLRHELAYILGQMQDENACDTLEKIVRDTSDDAMVRHEAAEALGAIGAKRSVTVLEQFVTDVVPEVSQTCQLALDLMAWRRKNGISRGDPGGQQSLGGERDKNPYLSVDPAPSCVVGAGGKEDDRDVKIEDLGEQLRDQARSLFDRYRAMFSLRNRGGEAAALALASAFQDEDNALFKHEVAYVLGQMQYAETVPALAAVLADRSEHVMVRHETHGLMACFRRRCLEAVTGPSPRLHTLKQAADALGAIGGEEAERLLREFKLDDVAAVKESCEVALDTIDYWETRS